MPCYSTIQRTKMTDAARLEEAMRALGYDVRTAGGVVDGLKRGVEEMRFSRATNAASPFVTYATDVARLQEIQRKYSELSVRAWAKRSGYSVAASENEGQKLTLINRRGK